MDHSRANGPRPDSCRLAVRHDRRTPTRSARRPGHRPAPGAYAARQLTLLLDGWREKYPDVPVSQNVVHGHPGQALADLSARADLVVIGRHTSHPSLPGPGSVRHAVLNHAHGPIAVVPSS